MWVLEAVYEIVEQNLFPSYPDAVVYPLDKSQVKFYGFARARCILSDWRPGFLNAGAPLVFISIFKLLDMLVEWILEENGYRATFRFIDKLKHIQTSPHFPKTIESRPWLKERLVGLYSTLEPLRGTIIHDKLFSATDGAIQVSSSRKGTTGSLVDVSAAHLRKLALTLVSILRYLDGTWKLDDLREKYLRYDLDELVMLHRQPLLGQKRPFHTTIRVYTKEYEPLDIDVATIHDQVSKMYVGQDCSFDLRILTVTGGEVLGAYLFPWAVIASPNSDWLLRVNAHEFKTAIPDDINPEHLCNCADFAHACIKES